MATKIFLISYDKVMLFFFLTLVMTNCSDGPTGPRINHGPDDGEYYGEAFWGLNGKIIFAYTPRDSAGNYIVDSSGWYSIRPDGLDRKLLFLTDKLLLPHGISRDGKWIAAHGDGQLYKIAATGDSIIQLTSGPTRKFYPTWSPDGLQLAFTVDDLIPFKERGIYRINSNGGDSYIWKNIDTTQPSAIMPSWSPVGSEIAFVKYRSGYGFKDLAVFDTITAKIKILLQTNIGVNDPIFSPDGSKIVFWMVPESGNSNIFVVNRDGNNLHQLTLEGGTYPSWSPDGSKIVYLKYTFNRELAGSDNGTLWIMNADGSNKYQLTF